MIMKFPAKVAIGCWSMFLLCSPRRLKEIRERHHSETKEEKKMNRDIFSVETIFHFIFSRGVSGR